MNENSALFVMAGRAKANKTPIQTEIQKSLKLSFIFLKLPTETWFLTQKVVITLHSSSISQYDLLSVGKKFSISHYLSQHSNNNVLRHNNNTKLARSIAKIKLKST